MDLHPAIELMLEIWGYLFGLWLVLWLIGKFLRANRIIEDAKNLPGGKNYVKPKLAPLEEEEEFEELSWRAHA